MEGWRDRGTERRREEGTERKRNGAMKNSPSLCPSVPPSLRPSISSSLIGLRCQHARFVLSYASRQLLQLRRQPRPWLVARLSLWEVSVKIRKPVFILVICLVVVSLIGSAAIADTVKLRDGSILKGKVVSYTQRKFTIEVYIGGAVSQHVVPVEEVESVEFDPSDAGAVNRADPAGAGAVSRADPAGAGQPPAQAPIPRGGIPRDNAPEIA